MAALREMFEQAATVCGARLARPSAQAGATQERLAELYRKATSGDDPELREAAMRHYIELVGDMQQQDG